MRHPEPLFLILFLLLFPRALSPLVFKGVAISSTQSVILRSVLCDVRISSFIYISFSYFYYNHKNIKVSFQSPTATPPKGKIAQCYHLIMKADTQVCPLRIRNTEIIGNNKHLIYYKRRDEPMYSPLTFLKFKNQDLVPRFSLIRIAAIIGIIRLLYFLVLMGCLFCPMSSIPKRRFIFYLINQQN